MTKGVPVDNSDLEAQLNALTELMNKFQAEIEPLQQTKAAVKEEEKAAYDEYIAKVAAARQKQTDIDAQMFEAQKAINKARQEAEALKRQKEQMEAAALKAQQAAAAQEAFKSMEDRWDKLTMLAPWREWAKDHQIEGAHKVTGDRKVIIADPMGLGKTLTAIITCDIAEAATKEASPEFPFLGEEKEVYVSGEFKDDVFVQGHYENKVVGGIEKPVGRKILYFCPSPMIKNVESEFRLWSPKRNVTFIGGMNKNERNFVFDFVLPMQDQYVVICNYEAWRKDLSLIDRLVKCEFDTVIIDEAHIIKEIKSIAYRGVKRLCDELNPAYIMPMTGTPILNRPQELFALLSLVDPRQFYDVHDFLYTYCEQDDDGRWKFQAGGLDLISKRIGKHFMRRTRDQAGIELPPKTVTVHNLQVDKEAYPNQARVREQMKKHAMIMIDEAAGKAIAATVMITVYTRLRQIETWPAGIEIVKRDPLTKEVISSLKVDVEESQKMDYLIHWDEDSKEFEGLIPEVVEDERCVVFSQFKAPLRELKDRIERMGKTCVILDGETSMADKDMVRLNVDARHVESQRAQGKPIIDVLLCNYKVGGVGMNMTDMTQMFILDEEWNPGKRDQAYDRIHRIGQEKPVSIHVIRNEKTVDDWLAAIMDDKEKLVDGFNSKMVGVEDFKEAIEGGLI